MPNSTAYSLNEKLHSFVETLDSNELDNYRLLLCRAAGLLAPFENSPVTPTRDIAFSAVTRSLSDLVPTQLLWRGRRSFIDLRYLEALQSEAAEGQSNVLRYDRHSIGIGGPIADKLARSKELQSFVYELAPSLRATGVASYVYYFKPGDGLEPHVDTEIFSLNVLIMLHHEYIESPSHLVVYPPQQAVQRLLLEPGEVLVMDAAGLVHGRESMKRGESLTILTIGFKPDSLYERTVQ